MPRHPRTDAWPGGRLRWLCWLTCSVALAVPGSSTFGQLVIDPDDGEQAVEDVIPGEAFDAPEPSENAVVESIPAPETTLSTEPSLSAEEIRQEIDRAVEARLGGIPRPRYIPATDFAPPRGLLLYKEAPRSGDFKDSPVNGTSTSVALLLSDS